MPRSTFIETHTVHTVRIDISTEIKALVAAGFTLGVDELRVVFVSEAVNQQMTPVKLSYSSLMRLMRDHS